MPGDTFDSAFLTGGTGFVGTHLRERLAARELPVTLLARNPEAVTARANESVVQGDITDPESLDVSGDTVVHLAADTNVPGSVERPTRAWEINADGTQNVLEAARNADAERFCYVSTASVYGPPTYLPIDEAHPMNPAEPYGASKLAGDRLTAAYASAYDLSTVIVRPFNLFGPGQPEYNVVPTIVEQALESETVELGNLSPSRDFTYVEDAVDGIVRALESGESGEAYNLGRGESVSIGTLTERIVEQAESDATVVSTSDRQRDDDIEIPEHAADASKLRGLGWSPSYGLRDGIDETIRAAKR
jgi:nucleoside-diphosphate-sugar epimerase